jgi:hypothetical protein
MRQFLLPGLLLLVVTGPPSNMMNGAHPHPAGPFLRSTDHIGYCARIPRVCGIPEPVSFLLDQLESHRLGKERGGSLIARLGQRGAVKTVNCVLRRDGTVLVRSLSVDIRGRNQFDTQIVGIGKRKNMLPSLSLPYLFPYAVLLAM